MNRKALAAVAIGAALVAPTTAYAEINIGISVSPPAAVVVAPPPAVVVASPPRVVAIPGSGVYYAPSASYNLFVYGGLYYSFHNGMWFVAAGPHAEWAAIGPDLVPPPVLAVPVTYYRVPPGHARKMGHHGPAEPQGCPPGLAKHGRC